MRSVLAAIGLVLITAMAWAAFEEPGKTVDSEGIAVVELFTSQGCSSCPPADKLLRKAKQNYQDKPVYCLSFHVTYWNHLGWEDPYSKKSYSQRQRQYAQSLGSSSVYTPQMVVNGQKAFVGSDKAQGYTSIDRNLKEEPLHNIDLSSKPSDEGLSISYELEGPVKSYLLHIALVEGSLQNHVPRGENRNRNLRHKNVVRSFKTVDPSTSVTATMKVPKSVDKQDAAVIAYIQKKDNLKITGAGAVSLSARE